MRFSPVISRYERPRRPLRTLGVAALLAACCALGALGMKHSLAQTDADAEAAAAKAALRTVYERRPDLQKAFSSTDWSATTPTLRAAGLMALEDWAKRYGYKEAPVDLAWFAPKVPRALEKRPAAYVPARATTAQFNFGTLTASSVMVVDVATREVLLSRNPTVAHPLASITKLMTATVALERGASMTEIMAISESDEVGGARLRVADGVPLTVRQIFDAMLVGSANNCALAMSRSTPLSQQQFIAAMNAKAREFGMRATTFVDPSGIEVANTSTAEDIAALGFEAFGIPDVKRATTTAKYTFVAPGEPAREIKNTNGLLTDMRNGLYVQGGKTGYLIESKWNLVVQMKDYRNRPVLVVVLGSASQPDSFKDAERAARWVWANYKWVKS